jgi:hypothetical protein
MLPVSVRFNFLDTEQWRLLFGPLCIHLCFLIIIKRCIASVVLWKQSESRELRVLLRQKQPNIFHKENSVLLKKFSPLVPDPLLLRKPRSAGNRNRDLWICSQEL